MEATWFHHLTLVSNRQSSKCTIREELNPKHGKSYQPKARSSGVIEYLEKGLYHIMLLGFELLPSSVYPPDLVPSDLFLYSPQKNDDWNEI